MPARCETTTWLTLTALPSSTGRVGSRSCSSASISRAMPGVPSSTCSRSPSLAASASVRPRRSLASIRMFSPSLLLGGQHPLAGVEEPDRLGGVLGRLADERAAAVEQPLQRDAGLVEHGAELVHDDPEVLLVDRADELVELDEQVTLVDGDRLGGPVQGVAGRDVRSVVVGRLEVEVLLADRRQVVDVHRRVRRQLGAVLEREVEGHALGGRLHPLDLADLDAAVGHLAALEEPARGRAAWRGR